MTHFLTVFLNVVKSDDALTTWGKLFQILSAWYRQELSLKRVVLTFDTFKISYYQCLLKKIYLSHKTRSTIRDTFTKEKRSWTKGGEGPGPTPKSALGITHIQVCFYLLCCILTRAPNDSFLLSTALFTWPHHCTVLEKHAYDNQNIKQTALIII